jgi:hypothetical protein
MTVPFRASVRRACRAQPFQVCLASLGLPERLAPGCQGGQPELGLAAHQIADDRAGLGKAAKMGKCPR